MGKREIIQIPDPVLRSRSRPVERVDDDVRCFLDDMLETMYAAPGIGLAAVQVGEAIRAITIDISAKADEDEEHVPDPLFFINPEIIWRSDELNIYEEGCLSIPEYYADVERPASCRVSFVDRAGNKQEMNAEGLLATCIQHEVDHLDGVLFIDHLSKLKRDMVVRKFTKIAKQNGAVL